MHPSGQPSAAADPWTGRVVGGRWRILSLLDDSGGKGYLSDFGIVKAGGEATMTGTGMFIGTLQFMSPEQCHRDGKQSLDGRSDQYGLAVTVYQVLTGWKYPVDDDTAVVYAAKFGHSPMTEPREHAPLVPQAVNDAVMRALATDRDKRFSSSVEFAKAVLAGFGDRDTNPSTERHPSVGGPASGTNRASNPTKRPTSAAVDTTPHRAGLATAAGNATVQPGREGTPPATPPAVARKTARRLGAAAIGMALLAGGFFLGRGEGPRGGDGGSMTGAIDVAEPRATAAVTPRPATPVESALPPVAPAVVEPAPVLPAGPRDFDVVANSLGMRLVAIPAGEFEMGSSDGDADERPVHRVRITRPFLIGQTEVTQGQWDWVMGSTPWKGKSYVKEGPDVAASFVTWDNAVAFCGRLTELERRAGSLAARGVYRLPTEAEWEYACRAGTTTTWSFGDGEGQLGEFAWFRGNAQGNGEEYAHEVGLKRANPWKLHDVHGNVYEWCNDWYGPYQSGPEADPTGPVAGSFRVIRGGSWSLDPVYSRSANRNDGPPTDRGYNVGFRVVCELADTTSTEFTIGAKSEPGASRPSSPTPAPRSPRILEALLEKAIAARNVARLTLEGAEEASKRHLVTKAEFERVKADLVAAEAEVTILTIELEESRESQATSPESAP